MATTSNASVAPVPRSVREFIFNVSLKITTESPVCLLKVAHCVSVDFSWEMREGREFNSSFDWPAFWLQQQKNVQLCHWQLQSAHFTTVAENDPQQQNSSHRAGSTHASHYWLRDGLACSGPHCIFIVGWTTRGPLITSYRGTQPRASQTSG